MSLRRILAGTSLVVAVVVADAAASGAAEVPGLIVARAGQLHVDARVLTRGFEPASSPDGRRIAFQRNGQIFVIDATGRNERRLTIRRPGLHWPASRPAWSPDGRRIAFSGTRDLFTVTVASGRLTPLTQSVESWRGNVTPAYSPDGRTIAFARSTDAYNSDIFLMRASGGGLRRLTTSQGTHDSEGEESMPAWSPDGRTIVFVSNRDGNFELYRIDADGRNERRLTTTPRLDEESPRFSRDGGRLVFVRNGRVIVARADGRRARDLGAGSAADWR